MYSIAEVWFQNVNLHLIWTIDIIIAVDCFADAAIYIEHD